ncbi:hypothetical protein KKC91_02475 [bacterium]|nr:hypothetical protein [bacterium]
MKTVLKYKMHVVSHTHWDREWYRTFEEFRIRLVTCMDKILELFDQDPDFKYFTFDGQTVILEDYLELKPERERQLKKYIRQSRLLVGPWYTLPDEFLVSGESLVRNLLLGHKIAKRFGWVMEIGYLPDMFGHISQMPQILFGFNINSAVLSRGVEGEHKVGTEFFWKSPDGSKVLAVYLVTGYSNATDLLRSGNLPYNSESVLKIIKNIKDKIIPLATTPNVLLMKGCDHLLPQEGLPEIIKGANRLLNNDKTIQSNLPLYISKIKEYRPRLEIIKGELRKTKKREIYPGTLSSRVEIKQKNEEVQSLLEKWAEPFSSFAWSLGMDYPKDFLWQSWKYLLKNHAHDSICGCSIDEVDKDVVSRFNSARQIAEEITWINLEKIVQKINTFQGNKKIKEKGKLVLVTFNPLSWKRTDTAEATICISDPKVRYFVIEDLAGNTIPYQIITQQNMTGRQKIYTKQDDKKINAVFLSRDVPALGYKIYRVRPVQTQPKFPSFLKVKGHMMENEFFRVNINENGTLTILDKIAKARHKNMHCFEDIGDAGDLYNYSNPLLDRKILNPKKVSIRLVEKGPVRITFKIDMRLLLPGSLTKNKKSRSNRLITCSIVSYISLSTGSRRIDVITEVDNKARDHWLMVRFPTNIKARYTFAEGQFDLVRRNILLLKTKRWAKPPEPIWPQQSFVSIKDNKWGLTIINRGLPCYRAIKNKQGTILNLSLLRSIGKLYNKDFYIMKEDGNCIKVDAPFTPGAQCIGKHRFEYAIALHEKELEVNNIFRLAYQHNIKQRVLQTTEHKGSLPCEMSFISIEPEELIISAVKKAEDKDSLIIRLFNTSQKKIQGKLQFYKKIEKARLVKMNEEVIKDLNIVDENVVYFKAGESQIVTIELG